MQVHTSGENLKNRTGQDTQIHRRGKAPGYKSMETMLYYVASFLNVVLYLSGITSVVICRPLR